MVTRDDIAKGLQGLGLESGDMVFVHSSLKSFGRVDGGADAVIDALMGTVGQGGGLMMPSFPKFVDGEFGLVADNGIVFDLRVSPSCMGVITDTFWRRPKVTRSLHPTHSVAAWGARAQEAIEGHELCLCSCGEGSPFHKNCLLGGKILLIGVTHNSNTTLHTIEDTNCAPTRSAIIYYPRVIDMDGRVITVPTRPHLHAMPRRYLIMDEICRREGIQKDATIGSAHIRLIDARRLYQTGSSLIKNNPLFLLNMDELA
ncbi:MAG TPA: hypothetical protein DCL60_05505 [Armatimonadetes bacterium]|nr:hypothetical protein [Armatimonadota bacterium]